MGYAHHREQRAMPTSRQNPRPRASLGQCIAGWAASEPGYLQSLGVPW